MSNNNYSPPIIPRIRNLQFDQVRKYFENTSSSAFESPPEILEFVQRHKNVEVIEILATDCCLVEGLIAQHNTETGALKDKQLVLLCLRGTSGLTMTELDHLSRICSLLHCRDDMRVILLKESEKYARRSILLVFTPKSDK